MDELYSKLEKPIKIDNNIYRRLEIDSNEQYIYCLDTEGEKIYRYNLFQLKESCQILFEKDNCNDCRSVENLVKRELFVDIKNMNIEGRDESMNNVLKTQQIQIFHGFLYISINCSPPIRYYIPNLPPKRHHGHGWNSRGSPWHWKFEKTNGFIIRINVITKKIEIVVKHLSRLIDFKISKKNGKTLFIVEGGNTYSSRGNKFYELDLDQNVRTIVGNDIICHSTWIDEQHNHNQWYIFDYITRYQLIGRVHQLLPESNNGSNIKLINDDIILINDSKIIYHINGDIFGNIFISGLIDIILIPKNNRSNHIIIPIVHNKSEEKEEVFVVCCSVKNGNAYYTTNQSFNVILNQRDYLFFKNKTLQISSYLSSKHFCDVSISTLT